jgi:hypothetical protein
MRAEPTSNPSSLVDRAVAADLQSPAADLSQAAG